MEGWFGLAWLPTLIGLLSIAVTILIGVIIGVVYTGRQFRRASEVFATHMGEAVRAIHDDITHSQEKLEREIDKKRGAEGSKRAVQQGK